MDLRQESHAFIDGRAIDPFVLNLAQGGASGLPGGTVGAAIVIATASNNILKAVDAVAFGGRTTAPSALALAGLAAAVQIGYGVGRLGP